MQVIVNGLLTHYECIGKGKVVLVLHGWGDDSRNWQQLQKTFSQDYQVLTVDLPGFGGSGTPEDTWSLDAYAVFVNDFLLKVGIPKVHAIIGHSNGGAIAIRGLAKGLLHTEQLVLLGGAGIRNEQKGRNQALRYFTKAGKALTAPLPRKAKKSLRQKVYRSVGSDMLVAEHMQETFKKVISDDVREDASRIIVPTLLVYGADDTDTPPRYGNLFHERMKNSKLEVMQNAGHFVYQDRPVETAKLIQEFLK